MMDNRNQAVSTPRMTLPYRTIAAIERFGNKLPQPFWLFWILAVVLGVVSLALSLADVSVTLPDSTTVVSVKNLFSLDGIAFAGSSALTNFADFPPLTIIIVMLLGVSIAERSGLLEALLRLTVIRLPRQWVTFALAFSGMIAHIMGDSAYLVMIPLGALAYRSLGRSPLLGVMVAYVSVSAGFNASPLVTPSDAIRASIATKAATAVDPGHVITPVATYFFSAASSVLLAAVLTLVVEKVLARRPDYAVVDGVEDLPPDPDEAHAGASAISDLSGTLTTTEARGLALSGLTFALYAATITVLLLLPRSPLRGENGSLVQSVVLVNLSVFLSLMFALLGIVYGRIVGTVPSLSEVPGVMAEAVKKLAPVIVLFFAISQFLAFFTWTGIGQVMTVKGAALLRSLDAPHVPILLAIVVGVSLINIIVTSGSAMWAVFAPVLVPMMLYIHVPPEAAMASFMIGDSVTNAVTPMSPYFILALGFAQQYRKDAGIGTLMSFTVPVAASILVAWSAFFALWYGLGIPLGPGTPT
jgi:aminobenzoyl-glutamate transport protein